jgi:hypothetical protein
MAIDFPASPTNGQTFTSGSVTYTYDGTKWTALASGGGATDKIEEGNTSAEVIDTGSDGRFVVTTEGSERARVDSSGRLLVGTSSTRTVSFWDTPHFLFEGTDYQKSGFCVYNNQNEIYGAFLSLGHSRGTSVGSNTVLQSGDYVGTIVFHGSDGSNEIRAAEISAFVDGTPGANDMPGRLVFSTTADGASSPTERMRISQNGLITCTSNNTSGGSFAVLFQNSANTELFKIENNGTWFTGNAAQSPYNLTTALAANLFVDASKNLYRSTSSERYKKNIETLEDCYADNILNCRPVWYQSTCSGDNPDWGFWGFIAEEVEKIDPRLCFYGKDEEGNPRVESVQYDRFVPHLLNLVKRQQQAIETLEAKVAALEGV